MRYLALLFLSVSLFSYEYRNYNHNCKIWIPDDWKKKEHTHSMGNDMEEIFSAHTKKTYEHFFKRYYEQSLCIKCTRYRASMYYEDLENEPYRKSVLRHLVSDIKHSVHTFSSLTNPIKNSNYYKKDNNYYFEIEFTDRDKEHLREAQGYYYHIFTPTCVFSITLSCPDTGVFNKKKDSLKRIIQSFSPIYL